MQKAGSLWNILTNVNCWTGRVLPLSYPGTSVDPTAERFEYTSSEYIDRENNHDLFYSNWKPSTYLSGVYPILQERFDLTMRKRGTIASFSLSEFVGGVEWIPALNGLLTLPEGWTNYQISGTRNQLLILFPL